jgi:hypothetical protein
LRIIVPAITDEKYEAGHRGAPSGIRSEKIRAFFDGD